jgi:hypothetical protein
MKSLVAVPMTFRGFVSHVVSLGFFDFWRASATVTTTASAKLGLIAVVVSVNVTDENVSAD